MARVLLSGHLLNISYVASEIEGEYIDIGTGIADDWLILVTDDPGMLPHVRPADHVYERRPFPVFSGYFVDDNQDASRFNAWIPGLEVYGNV